MISRRYRRWGYLLLALLFCTACLAGYAWSILTPEIGEPFVAPAQADSRDKSPATGIAPREKLWSFGFVGDTHAGLGDDMIDQIFARFEAAGLEFVLHLGDMVDVGASDAQWDQLARQAHARRVRLMPVVGNHDVHRGYPGDRGEIRWRQYFPQLPETFYSFSHRGLNFVMLNSERILSPGSEQAKYLARQLREQPGTTLVCLHRPVFTCGKRDLVWVLARRLWLHRVLRGTDAVCVLTGHNHYYERTRPLDGIAYLVSGGGAPNQYGAEHPNAGTARFVSGRAHYGLVDVYTDHLSVRVIDLEKQVLDEFDLPIRSSSAGGMAAHAKAWGRELPSIASIQTQGSDAPLATVAAPANIRPADVAPSATRPLPRVW